MTRQQRNALSDRSQFGFAIGWLLSFTTLLAAQAPAPATAPTPDNKRNNTISGRVITDDGQPVSNLRVFAVGAGNPGNARTVTSDDEGNFQLTDLAPGAYLVSGFMPAYVTVSSQSSLEIRRPGDYVTLRLSRGGVITGRVTDAAGDPVVGAYVTAKLVRNPEGQSLINSLPPQLRGNFGGSSMTDDRGVYRLFGLEPGVYVVSVSYSSGFYGEVRETGTYTPTYYPSATRETAAELTIRGSEEITGIDIRPRGEQGHHTISGWLAGDTDSTSHFGITLVSLFNANTQQLERTEYVSNEKGFALFGIPDGEYDLVALRDDRKDDSAESLAKRVVVRGADVSGVELKLARHGSLSGRVTLTTPPETAATTSCPAKTTALLEEILFKAERFSPTQMIAPTAPWRFDFVSNLGSTPNDKGEFTLKGLAAGRYRLAINLPGEQWYVHEIKMAAAAGKPPDPPPGVLTVNAGQKVSGLTVALLTGAATLQGQVVTKEGQKRTGRIRIHLLPAEPAAADNLFRYAETLVASNGTFSFQHLAPGKYWLATRPIPETEPADAAPRPLAWDATERAKLRKQAATAKLEVELKPCQRMADFVVRY